MRYVRGDILAADAEALVNTVNCVGVMGRGIALQFKKAFPENFRAYAAACEQELVQPGHMFVFDAGELARPRWIINFPTKRHWRGKSRLEDIEAGLVDLVRKIEALGIRSIAVPPLGSGLGGLDWSIVRPMIERALSSVPDLQATVFEPGGGPEPDGRTDRSRSAPKMTAGRAAMVGLMRRYLAGMMDVSISLLELHKLMYFLQAAGEPLRLQYKKAPYGPYAENLRHVLRDVDGHLVDGYGDGGDKPSQALALVPGAAEDAQAFLDDHSATLERFERVARLVDGFESPFGLELLATTHWVGVHENAQDPEAAVSAVHGWNSAKLQFTPNQVRLALDRLRDQGWFAATT